VKVYIVGKGAVGSFLGAELERIGVDVIYAPRDPAAITPVDADVAIVAVKAYDTPGAIATLRAAIRNPQTCVFVTPQNGIGNEELLAEAFGADNVVAAALTVPVGRDRDGNAGAAGAGGLALSPMGRNAYNWLVATFASTGMPVWVIEDWRALKWSKLSLNVLANAACAILNVLPDRLVHYDAVFPLEILMLREVRAVMRRLKVVPVDLPRYPVRALMTLSTMPLQVGCLMLGHRIAHGRGNKPPSLLLDLRAGKHRSEVSVLNGAVAREGARLGVATPVNAVYARVLEDIVQMPQLWAKYRENPHALAAEVEAERERMESARVRSSAR